MVGVGDGDEAMNAIAVRSQIDRGEYDSMFSAAQLRFMAMHARRLVIKWVWYMKGAQLRAYTDCGRVTTITATEFADLVDVGCAEQVGCAGVRLTKVGVQVGRAACVR